MLQLSKKVGNDTCTIFWAILHIQNGILLDCLIRYLVQF